MFENIQAVIFDCDGTLVDSETLSIETLITYAGEFGLQMDVSEAVHLFAGGQLENAVAEMERRIGSRLPGWLPPRRKSVENEFRRLAWRLVSKPSRTRKPNSAPRKPLR